MELTLRIFWIKYNDEVNGKIVFYIVEEHNLLKYCKEIWFCLRLEHQLEILKIKIRNKKIKIYNCYVSFSKNNLLYKDVYKV